MTRTRWHIMLMRWRLGWRLKRDHVPVDDVAFDHVASAQLRAHAGLRALETERDTVAAEHARTRVNAWSVRHHLAQSVDVAAVNDLRKREGHRYADRDTNLVDGNAGLR